MAFPSVATTATTMGFTAAINMTLNLPGSIVAGNTLIVIVRKSNETASFGWPAGWTIPDGGNGDASDDRAEIAWRKADGTEGATITVTGVNTSKYASVAYQIQSAADPTVTAPYVGAGIVSGGPNTTPDPPARTPPDGAKDYFWMAIGTWEGEQASPPTFPANYTLNQLDQNSGTAAAVATNCQTACGCRQLNATTDDPGTYTISASDDWMCTTWVISPAPAAPPGPVLNANPLLLLGVGRKLP